MAVGLGYPHPDHLLRQLTSSQLTELIAFYQLEPFGPERGDLGHAIVASTVANVHRGKGRKPFGPRDFMPFVEKRLDTEELSEQIKAALRSVNGKPGKSRNPDRG